MIFSIDFILPHLAPAKNPSQGLEKLANRTSFGATDRILPEIKFFHDSLAIFSKIFVPKPEFSYFVTLYPRKSSPKYLKNSTFEVYMIRISFCNELES